VTKYPSPDSIEYHISLQIIEHNLKKVDNQISPDIFEVIRRGIINAQEEHQEYLKSMEQEHA